MQQTLDSPSQASIEKLIEALDRANPLGARRLLRAFTTGIATALGATVGVSLTLSVLGSVLNALGYFEPFKDVTTSVKSLLEAPGQHQKK